MTSGPYVAQPYDDDLLAIAGLSGTGYLQRTGAATWSLGSPSSTPTAITVANEATDTTCFVGFFTAATGDLGPKTNTGLTFNSATGAFGVTGNVAASGTGTFQSTGTHTFGTTNTVTMAEGVVTATGTSKGGSRVNIGGIAQTGYFAWFKPNGTRQGYMGYDSDNDIGFYNEQGGVLKTNCSVAVTGSIKPGTKTIATLPSAASSTGERYQLSDSATIVNRVVFSNGSAWYYEGTAVAV